MAIESQENVITCCNGKTYTRSNIIYRGYIFLICLGLIFLLANVEALTIDGMTQRRLVDIHVFICTIGGVWMLISILVISPKDINQKQTGHHSVFGFLSCIVITAGTALLHGNTKHTFLYHSIAGFTCVIAIWIQIVLGFIIFKQNLTKKDKLWWAKVMHIVLGLVIITSISLCFITGFNTVRFKVLQSFWISSFDIWIIVITVLLALLILFIPLYRLTKENLKCYHNST